MKNFGLASLTAIGLVYGAARLIPDEPKDLPGGRYVASISYPKIDAKLPLMERRVKTTETEGEFRVGAGNVHRLPFTRTGLVFGVWVGTVPGESLDEKLRAVLEARDVEESVDEISGWGR